MADSAPEQLLGYLLGALEDSEQKLVEDQLQGDSRLRRELALLEKGLKPLEAARGEFSPPPGLATKTCRFVAARAERPTAANSPRRPATTPRMQPMSAAAAGPSGTSRWNWWDMAVALGILVAASLLVLPAIQNSRFTARLTTCQDNLRQIGLALSQYSRMHAGYFPYVPPRGKLKYAGIYAPTLSGAGLLQDANWVICPASLLAGDRKFHMPSLEELRAAVTRDELNSLRRLMGGSYGYCMGFVEEGTYHCTRNLGRTFFALMSDAPGPDLPGHQSLNHGGRGQNVLFEDGRVIFLTTPKPGDHNDHFFLNDRGEVGAGDHRNDSVIGSSLSTPIIYVNLQD